MKIALLWTYLIFILAAFALCVAVAWANDESWMRVVFAFMYGFFVRQSIEWIRNARAEQELIRSGRGGPILPPDDPAELTQIDEPNVFVGQAAQQTKRVHQRGRP